MVHFTPVEDLKSSENFLLSTPVKTANFLRESNLIKVINNEKTETKRQ